ncbi:MAG: hypothetical protein HY795_12070 [Desulfovibrio sp.]|nr:hypothetical protein [Desulfovibrio sp.]MBI4958070.1 hypothetical protein [Desulfovibrio sp.]
MFIRKAALTFNCMPLGSLETGTVCFCERACFFFFPCDWELLADVFFDFEGFDAVWLFFCSLVDAAYTDAGLQDKASNMAKTRHKSPGNRPFQSKDTLMRRTLTFIEA